MHVQDVQRVPMENCNSLMFRAGGLYIIFSLFISVRPATFTSIIFFFGGGDNFGIVRVCLDSNATSIHVAVSSMVCDF